MASPFLHSRHARVAYPRQPSASSAIGLADLAAPALDPRFEQTPRASRRRTGQGNASVGHGPNNHKVPDMNASAKRKFVLRFEDNKWSNDLLPRPDQGHLREIGEGGHAALEDKANVKCSSRHTRGCQRLMNAHDNRVGREAQHAPHRAGQRHVRLEERGGGGGGAPEEDGRASGMTELARKRKREETASERDSEKRGAFPSSSSASRRCARREAARGHRSREAPHRGEASAARAERTSCGATRRLWRRRGARARLNARRWGRRRNWRHARQIEKERVSVRRRARCSMRSSTRTSLRSSRWRSRTAVERGPGDCLGRRASRRTARYEEERKASGESRVGAGKTSGGRARGFKKGRDGAAPRARFRVALDEPRRRVAWRRASATARAATPKKRRRSRPGRARDRRRRRRREPRKGDAKGEIARGAGASRGARRRRRARGGGGSRARCGAQAPGEARQAGARRQAAERAERRRRRLASASRTRRRRRRSCWRRCAASRRSLLSQAPRAQAQTEQKIREKARITCVATATDEIYEAHVARLRDENRASARFAARRPLAASNNGVLAPRTIRTPGRRR